LWLPWELRIVVTVVMLPVVITYPVTQMTNFNSNLARQFPVFTDMSRSFCFTASYTGIKKQRFQIYKANPAGSYVYAEL
jgi:hypothetical protein